MSGVSEPEAQTATKHESAGRRRFSWRSRRGLVIVVAVAVVLAAAAVVAFGLIRGSQQPASDPVAVTVPVPIGGIDVPAGTKIGVIVTTGTGNAEGADWSRAAEGAVVARERLALGGSDIQLVVENDKGTPAGAHEAATALVEQGVAGIVYASSGEQLDAGIAVAIESKVGVVLPFAEAPASSVNVWSLAPTESDVQEQFSQALEAYERPLHLDAGPGLPDGVRVPDVLQHRTGSDIKSLAMQVAEMTGSDPLAHGGYAGGSDDDEQDEADAETVPEQRVDAIVLSGPAALQANITRELQARNVTVPILLTPGATSQRFEDTLIENGAAVSSALRTFGYDWDDAVALGNDGRGRTGSGFLAAIRVFSADSEILNLTEDSPFAEVSGAADGRAHDALLVLARAVSDAGSTDPAKVATALAGLALVAGDAITGPEMDFASSQAVAAPTVMLYATGQQLGLRPESGADADALVWFAEPAAK